MRMGYQIHRVVYLDYLNVNDEVSINSRVMIVVDLDASNLRFRTESRLLNTYIFNLKLIIHHQN